MGVIIKFVVLFGMMLAMLALIPPLTQPLIDTMGLMDSGVLGAVATTYNIIPDFFKLLLSAFIGVSIIITIARWVLYE